MNKVLYLQKKCKTAILLKWFDIPLTQVILQLKKITCNRFSRKKGSNCCDIWYVNIYKKFEHLNSFSGSTYSYFSKVLMKEKLITVAYTLRAYWNHLIILIIHIIVQFPMTKIIQWFFMSFVYFSAQDSTKNAYTSEITFSA